MTTEHSPEEDVAGGLMVIRLGALGDVANTIPAVAALRRLDPPPHIAWVVEEGARDLVAAAGVADEVLVFPRRRIAGHLRRPWTWPKAAAEFLRFVRAVRAKRYDAALDFQGNLKSGLLAMTSGCALTVGFARGHCREGNWLFTRLQAVPASRRMPRAEKNAALAQVLTPEIELGPVEIPVHAERAAAARAFAAEFSRRGPLLLLHPGTSAFGDFKRWPAERYGALAARLAERHNARCAVSWGPSERALAEAVAAASQGCARPTPALDIPGLIELIRAADLFVAADTGRRSNAAMCSGPEIYAPYGTRAEIVRAGLPCSPCTRRHCAHGRCMKEISVEQALSAAERLLTAREPER